MRLDAFEPHAESDGLLQRLDPRLKLLATLGFVIAVVVTPLGSWRLFAFEALGVAFALGVSGLPPRAAFERALGFLALVAFLAALAATAHPARRELGWAVCAGSILLKNALALFAVLVLIGVTPLRMLIAGLRRLGMPTPLAVTLQLQARYLFVLLDELERMAQARRARSFRRGGRLDWGLLTSLLGVLFVRSLERGERVHASMLARGWNGADLEPLLDDAA